MTDMEEVKRVIVWTLFLRSCGVVLPYAKGAGPDSWDGEIFPLAGTTTTDQQKVILLQ